MVDSGQSTIIGPSIIINGNLQGDEDLTVLGRVEGTVNLTKTLNVAESGIVKADITVKDAIVSGVVVGNITASDSVEITEAGRMVGDIRAPRVIIVDGARFRGTVDMGDLEAPRASAPLPARTVSTKGGGAPKAVGPAARPSPIKGKALPPAPAPVAKAAAPKVAMPAPKAPVPAVTVPATAPIAAKKKIKKKVVVKRKEE